MLDLFSSHSQLQEAQWSLQLLEDLDWQHFHELVGRLLHRAGYLPEVAWTRPDGGTALTLMHPARPLRLEAIVQCAPWLHFEIDASAVAALHAAMLEEGANRGIFVTPGVFSEATRSGSRTTPVELVDGSDLLNTLQRLPLEERRYLLRMATVGPYMIPTCPSCATKMQLIDDTAGAQGQRVRDLIYSDRTFESKDIDCRSLTLRKGADVVFMKSVTAGTMTVHGKATGNLVINGCLHVTGAGCVRGLVSARAIRLDPGGTLEAEARILNESELAHLRPMPVPQIWRCPRYPKCRATLPVR